MYLELTPLSSAFRFGTIEMSARESGTKFVALPPKCDKRSAGLNFARAPFSNGHLFPAYFQALDPFFTTMLEFIKIGVLASPVIACCKKAAVYKVLKWGELMNVNYGAVQPAWLRN